MSRRVRKAEPYRLLVVDWDYFLPMPEHPGLHFDWAHSETPFHMGPLWQMRAAQLDAYGVPRPQLNDEWRTFWQRFSFTPDARLYWADSNARAVTPQVAAPGRPTTVWLYDAHHDSGYQGDDPQDVALKSLYTCENWMIFYAGCLASLHVRYPAWKTWWKREAASASLLTWSTWDAALDLGGNPAAPFDRIFVCRSAAWVPPWCDRQFAEFLDLCPVASRECLEPGGKLEPRRWDEDHIAKLADQIHSEARAFKEALAAR